MIEGQEQRTSPLEWKTISERDFLVRLAKLSTILIDLKFLDVEEREVDEKWPEINRQTTFTHRLRIASTYNIVVSGISLSPSLSASGIVNPLFMKIRHDVERGYEIFCFVSKEYGGGRS